MFAIAVTVEVQTKLHMIIRKNNHKLTISSSEVAPNPGISNNFKGGAAQVQLFYISVKREWASKPLVPMEATIRAINTGTSN